MAIYSAVPPPPEYPPVHMVTQTPPQPPTVVPNSSATGIDIDAWTISALQSLSVSPVARGTGTPLAIPLDGAHQKFSVSFGAADDDDDDEATPRRPPSRRDSQRKREMLLKGKEGTRQRRRWENDRLMHVPNAQPPEPRDWQVHPTHPIHRVPYQLAQFWDRGVRKHAEDRVARLAAERKRQQLQRGSATGLAAGEVPRDLRDVVKRSPVVRGWVRGLEEPVRTYLADVGAEKKKPVKQQSHDSDDDVHDYRDGDVSAAECMDSEDEEIVFVGRSGAMRELKEKRQAVVAGGDGGWKRAHREVAHETVDSGMVFDSFGDDEGASFKRWLTHAISDYYGLESRSVTLSNPSRRVVYVGLKQAHQRMKSIPRPLWELC